MDTNEYQVGDLTKTLLSNDNVQENDFFANAAKREEVVETKQKSDDEEEVESDSTHESSEEEEMNELSKPKKKVKVTDSPEKLKRTIFVGNFPFQNNIKVECSCHQTDIL
jgi:hypothetical protein